MTHKLAILAQLPIVLMLVFLNFQAYSIKKTGEFKLIAIAWSINFVYLFFNYSSILVGLMPNLDRRVASVFFDLLSIFFFLCVPLKYSHRPIFSRARRVSVVVIILVFVTVFLFTILQYYFPHNSNVVNFWNIPLVILNCFCLLNVALFYKQYVVSFPRSFLLYWAALAYGILQLLMIFVIDEEPGPAGQDRIKNIGFFLGMASKFFMLVGMVTLITEVVKKVSIGDKQLEMSKAFAKKLNHIIGRTFHEVTPPLLEIESISAQLSPENELRSPEIQMNKKTGLQITKMESSIHRMKTILTASLKMYQSEAVQIDDIETYEFPIPIDDKTEINNINTLVEIAIMNFKSTLLKDLSPDLYVTDSVKFIPEYGGNCNIECNSVQIVQVFLNLFKNSFEARIDEKSACKIYIKTANHLEIDDDGNRSRKIIIEVEDNGPGISQEVLGDIFTQGFTTKKIKTGRDRGYGMSIIKSYTEENGGTISVESPPAKPYFLERNAGIGTKFILFFPKTIKNHNLI